MIKILGHSIAINKPIYIALATIYGIGYITSKKILKLLNINIQSKIPAISGNKLYKLKKYLLNIEDKLEDNLKRQISININHLKNIKCYKGQRHLKGLPSRGQRTRTNSRTSRNIFLIKKNSLSNVNKL